MVPLYVLYVSFCPSAYILLKFLISNIDEFALNRGKNNPKNKAQQVRRK